MPELAPDQEQQLRATLLRRDPDPGFPQRALARIAAANRPPRSRRVARPWRAAAVAALLVVIIGLGARQYELRQQAERAARAEQLQWALATARAQMQRITSAAMEPVLQQLTHQP